MGNYPLVPHVRRPAARANARPPTTTLPVARNEGGLTRCLGAISENIHVDFDPSYVAALELRVEKLERRLEFAKSLKASANAQKPDAAAAKNESAGVGQDVAGQDDTERRDSLAFIRDAVRRKAAKNKETADVNDIVSEFGFL